MEGCPPAQCDLDPASYVLDVDFSLVAAMPTYEPNPKHKFPKGYGTLCQRSVGLEHAQELLDRSVADDPDGRGLVRRRYSVCGPAAFEAKLHHGSDDAPESCWHGYPILGSDVPQNVIDRWVEAGDLDRVAARRLRRQRTLPEACGCWT